MKASQLLTIGVIVCAAGFVASSNPASSPAVFHIKKSDFLRKGGPAPCLIGTEKCSAQNNPPMKACFVGTNSTQRCPVDGFKVTEANLH
jgi:hypothetical protein